MLLPSLRKAVVLLESRAGHGERVTGLWGVCHARGVLGVSSKPSRPCVSKQTLPRCGRVWRREEKEEHYRKAGRWQVPEGNPGYTM